MTKTYCPYCREEIVGRGFRCSSCKRWQRDIFTYLSSVAIIVALILKWRFFMLEIYPMAASVLAARDHDFSLPIGLPIVIVSIFSEYLNLFPPIIFLIISALILCIRPNQKTGLRIVFLVLCIFFIFSTWVFLQTGFEALAALGNLGMENQ